LLGEEQEDPIKSGEIAIHVPHAAQEVINLLREKFSESLVLKLLFEFILFIVYLVFQEVCLDIFPNKM